MITMRNIWIMMLGICLFGCGAGKQPLSSQLSLTWKLEKDSVEARYFKNTFCLTNNGNKSLADNWVIYFNQTLIIRCILLNTIRHWHRVKQSLLPY